MSTLVTIDPGLRHCGLAVFRDGVLRAAYLVRLGADDAQTAAARFALATQVFSLAGHPDRLVIELPRIYPAARQKGDQNDLIQLATVAGAVVGRVLARHVEFIYPRTWKGTINADVMTERITERLTADESTRVEKCPASLSHNVYDAIGIGLHVLGRLEPRRVIAR